MGGEAGRHQSFPHSAISKEAHTRSAQRDSEASVAHIKTAGVTDRAPSCRHLRYALYTGPSIVLKPTFWISK